MMIAEYPHPIFSRFRGMILGIRPSIAWIVGLDDPGIDLLDLDGRSGWQVACIHMRAELDASADEFCGPDRLAAKALHRWLRYDESLEVARWNTPEVLIEHFVSTAMVCVDDEPMFNKDMFLEAWTRNFRYAAASLSDEPWQMPNSVHASIGAIIVELSGDKAAVELISLIRELVAGTDRGCPDARCQLVGPGFRPELTSVLRHCYAAPTRTSPR